jgi:DNA-binding transcriptional LysR family regulator
MFDPRRLVVLEAIAEHRSFTKAAGALFTSQPAVSRQIAALERELAAPLVVRDARTVALTAAGEALLEHARTLLPAIGAAAREVATHAAPDGGAVRLGAVPSAITSFIPSAIEALRADRPRVRVRINEGWGEDLVVRTSRGSLDLAVVSAAAARGFHRPTVLTSDDFDVWLPAGHGLADRSHLRLADLRGESWIVAPTTSGHLEIAAACAAAGFTPRIAAAASWGSAERLIAAGVGIALAPTPTDAPGAGVVVRPLVDGPRRHLVLIGWPGAAGSAVAADLRHALTAASKRFR